MSKKINYPHEDSRLPYNYVDINNPFMIEAMRIAKNEAFENGNEPKTPVGVVFVKGDKILVEAPNGSSFHKKNGCERKKLGIPSGERYDLCPGCDYENHAEPKAIAIALKKGIDIAGAEAYLFGEWWCCKPCMDKMIKAGIKNVYLLNNSEKYFNRDHIESKCTDFEFFENMVKG